MGRIHVLPDNIANKIAAGEVVERPASVAKELIENSLDAGATRLRIEVAGGGRSLIRVADDGSGMVRDDALLAFERHATSKLRSIHDLLGISSLGFRGEALPSIASVSRLTLETSHADEPVGSRVEIAGGRLIDVKDEALPPGTTISVRNLFYNVPARRKFLRTEKTELAHVSSLVTHYSLAHTGKTFYLANEHGTLLHAAPAAGLRERVYQVFGSDTLEQLVELKTVRKELESAWAPDDEERAAGPAVFSLRGFVSKPHVQKLSRNATYIFVNNRLIRDRVVLKALSSAYHNILPPGSFPFALLFLEMPFDEVDVNVHPSKTEVRFRHQSFVHDFVRDSVRELLIASKPVSAMPLPRSPAQPAVGLPYSDAGAYPPSEGPGMGAPRPVDTGFGLRPQAPPPGRFDFSPGGAFDIGSHEVSSWGWTNRPNQETAGPHPPTEASAPLDPRLHSRAPLTDVPAESLAGLANLRPLGQLHHSFIVATGHDGLWIIDQHVAHERILFEQVLRQRRLGKAESQRLLMPLILTLRPGQEIVFAQIEEEFRANGFEIEPFGRRTVAVKAAPAGLSPQEVETLIGEILDTPERELREWSLEDLQKRVAATIACHAAIKVNMPLDMTKMRWLLDELSKTDCPMACPHGRPIALKYDLGDILKAFHRV